MNDVRDSVPVMQTVLNTKGPIGSLGGAWMTSDAEEQLTVDVGLQGWELYFLARHGVLGDVDADVVTAGAYVFPQEHVRTNWEAARKKLTPTEGITLYLPLLHEWAHENLSGFTEVGRLTELAWRIIDQAEVLGLPLFAGWRAVPLPADPVAALGQTFNVLREHRGSCHGLAMVALGLSPLMAILTAEGGQQNAEEYGWQPPFPQPSAVDRELRARVEEFTDQLVARAYGGLNGAEQAEFADLISRAFSHAFGSQSGENA